MTAAQDRYVARARDAKRAFLKALETPDQTQHEAFRRAVDLNRDTAFGRQHDFAAMRSVDDFRQRVPIRDYRALAEWIDRAAAGEAAVLTADPPQLFFSSSGSTGDAKKIPVTATFVEQVYLPFFYAAIGNTIECCPAAIERDDATLNMKWDPMRSAGRTASGAAHLGASQVDFARSFGDELAAEPGTRAPWAMIPAEIDDELERMYVRLRLAVESDLRCVVGINPTMIAILPAQLDAWKERLIEEVREGTVLGKAEREPDPARAAELERLATYFGTLRPHHVWPRLELIYCWTAGVARTYLPGLRAAYGPEVEILPAPIAASEGPIGVPIDRHPTAGPLMLPCVFYEFVDADQALTPHSDTLLFDQLEVGADYHVILTHVGGLYRYALGDVARVVDRLGEVPRVEYGGRNTVSSIAGERFRETHILDAVLAALDRHGLAVRNFTCRAVETEPPHYAFLLEGIKPWSTSERRSLARSLDELLRRASPGYRRARDAGELAPVEVLEAKAGTFTRHFDERVANGVRPTQTKDRVFQNDEATWQRLVSGASRG